MTNLRMFTSEHKQRPLYLNELCDTQDWYKFAAKNLSNTLRWGGAFDREEGALSVAKHCCLVAQAVYKLTEDYQLMYDALHHEVEEAFGVGDIVYDVKQFIFQGNKDNYKAYKNILKQQVGISLEEAPVIKLVDMAVGFKEAEWIGCNPDETWRDIPADIRTQVTQIMGELNLQKVTSSHPRNDRDSFITLHEYLAIKLGV